MRKVKKTNKTAVAGIVVMEKDETSQLERQENKYRNAGICKRGT